MALDLTQKTDPPAPLTDVQILIGYKPPKNWKENSLKRQDQTYQVLLDRWDQETDPEKEEKRYQELRAYWAKRRAELGSKD